VPTPRERPKIAKVSHTARARNVAKVARDRDIRHARERQRIGRVKEPEREAGTGIMGRKGVFRAETRRARRGKKKGVSRKGAKARSGSVPLGRLARDALVLPCRLAFERVHQRFVAVEEMFDAVAVGGEGRGAIEFVDRGIEWRPPQNMLPAVEAQQHR
jgi:hypothetical protein